MKQYQQFTAAKSKLTNEEYDVIKKQITSVIADRFDNDYRTLNGLNAMLTALSNAVDGNIVGIEDVPETVCRILTPILKDFLEALSFAESYRNEGNHCEN